MRRALLALVAVPHLAWAEEAKKAEPAGFSHHKQFQLATRLAVGGRFIATYGKATYCGETDSSATTGLSRVCTGRSPLAIDFEAGYGIKPAIDLILELRVGIQQDFGPVPGSDDGPRPLHLSSGARFFFSESGRLRLFTTAQLVLDLTGYENSTGKALGPDFGIRNMSGIWLDLSRSFGFYMFAGETATFARWLRFELEGGVGIQGRFP